MQPGGRACYYFEGSRGVVGLAKCADRKIVTHPLPVRSARCVTPSDQISLIRIFLRPILFETFLRRALHRNINGVRLR
jgi:hypothetical protein